MKIKFLIFLCVLLIVSTNCTQKESEPLDGHWRAVWSSSGGEIPIDLYLKTSEGGEIFAEVHNDLEVVPFSKVEKKGNHIDLYIDRFECLISADLSEDGKTLTGKWSKQVGNPNQMPFTAQKGDQERFPIELYNPPAREGIMDDISGRWRMRFEGDIYDSVGLFRQDGDKVLGTARAIDGDFRWMEGIYRNGLLLLSSFNGTWVFLFKAEMDEQGKLNGYWARGPKKPVNWTAVKDDEAVLPDPFTVTELSNEEQRLNFNYPSAENPEKIVSNTDPEFEGKPLLAAFWLTGCPNCHDSAGLVSQMQKEFKNQGLEMVFIFFELTKDVPQTQARIKRFMNEHDLEGQVLYSLALNKKEIAEETSDFKQFFAWPTVVFYGPDGKVQDIHTGIDGPATGIYFENIVKEYRERITKLLEN